MKFKLESPLVSASLGENIWRTFTRTNFLGIGRKMKNPFQEGKNNEYDGAGSQLWKRKANVCPTFLLRDGEGVVSLSM